MNGQTNGQTPQKQNALQLLLGYGLGDFSVVWGVLGYFSDLREDKSIAHLLNLAGNQMGQSMTDF